MDPLEARSLFPIFEQRIHMNHAGVSPMSERVRAAVTASHSRGRVMQRIRAAARAFSHPRAAQSAHDNEPPPGYW